MELFLYRCAECFAAKLSDIDYGGVWYSECGTCRKQAFYEKVVIQQKMTLVSKGGFREDYGFVLEKSLYGKEKRNGDSDTGTNKKE